MFSHYHSSALLAEALGTRDKVGKLVNPRKFGIVRKPKNFIHSPPKAKIITVNVFKLHVKNISKHKCISKL